MKNPRLAARINQAVCSLEGLCAWFQGTPGDFAVVIHGERDCGNVVLQGTDTPGCERFFCTQLDEHSAVAGISGKRLEECLQAVCTELHPGRVFVLGTCTPALIGDDLGPVAKRVAARTSTPITALPVSSMRFVDQGEITDRFAVLMAENCQSAAREPQSVNLLGFDPGTELRDRLQARGLSTIRRLSLGSSLEDWQRLPAAWLNVLIDPDLYPDLLTETRNRFKQSDLQVPFPIGVAATSTFIAKILEALSLPAAPAGSPDPLLELARDALVAARQQTAGLRLGYNLGSLKNMDPQSLALRGLIDLPFFDELGLQIVVLVQGDNRRHRRAAVAKTLSAVGCQAEVAFFADTVDFGNLCRKQRCDLVYAPDFLLDQVKPQGIGFIQRGAIPPGFAGVPAATATVLNAIGPRRGSRA